MSRRGSEVLVRAALPGRYWLALGLFVLAIAAVLLAVVMGLFGDGWVGRGRVPIALVLGCGLVYIAPLLLWRAACRGVWVRCEGGVVEALGQWRWRPVGRAGEVTYEIESWRNGAVTVWLNGSQGRIGFNLPPGRTLEDSALPEFWNVARRLG